MLKLKKFESLEQLEKEVNKLKSKMDHVRDYGSEFKRDTIAKYTYNYYYYVDVKGNYKELTIEILTDNKNYYLLYDNKALNAGALLYKLKDIDYIKTFKFNEEYYRTYWSDKVKKFKSLNIDHNFYSSTHEINRYFEGLENIEVLKNICIEELKRI